MGTVILTSQVGILAAAAGPTKFGFHHGTLWMDLLAAALSGVVLLPLALSIMWLSHKARLDHWFVVTAFLATIFSVIIIEFVHTQVWEIYVLVEDVLHMIGVHRWVYLGFPNLLVCLFGALGFGWWLKRRPRDQLTETFE